MKNTALRLAAALLAAVCLVGAGQRTEDDIIRDLIVYRGCYGEEADAKVEGLLRELSERDSRRGELWRGIMDYWTYTDTDMAIHPGALPDGLPGDDSLCIIVLGYKLNSDGTMRDELVWRLRVALESARRYPNAYVLCTGGGTADEAPEMTEGRAMGDWLLANGLSPERLLVEDKSLNTSQNARNSYELLLKNCPAVDSAAIVTSGYHVARGSLMFETVFRMSAAERQTREIHVVSNAAYPKNIDYYTRDVIVRRQAGGMLQLVGQDELSETFFDDLDGFEKPAL